MPAAEVLIRARTSSISLNPRKWDSTQSHRLTSTSSLLIQATAHQPAGQYNSTAESKSDKRALEQICAGLPLDAARVCN
jgi:hypothetical protein